MIADSSKAIYVFSNMLVCMFISLYHMELDREQHDMKIVPLDELCNLVIDHIFI
jgi:hypothetical protein